jgi:hypothetical protein
MIAKNDQGAAMMGAFIALLGFIFGLICWVGAIGISPNGAPRQIVQELRYAEAMLDLLQDQVEVPELGHVRAQLRMSLPGRAEAIKREGHGRSHRVNTAPAA